MPEDQWSVTLASQLGWVCIAIAGVGAGAEAIPRWSILPLLASGGLLVTRANR